MASIMFSCTTSPSRGGSSSCQYTTLGPVSRDGLMPDILLGHERGQSIYVMLTRTLCNTRPRVACELQRGALAMGQLTDAISACRAISSNCFRCIVYRCEIRTRVLQSDRHAVSRLHVPGFVKPREFFWRQRAEYRIGFPRLCRASHDNLGSRRFRQHTPPQRLCLCNKTSRPDRMFWFAPQNPFSALEGSPNESGAHQFHLGRSG
jgi:hypothetical protein